MIEIGGKIYRNLQEQVFENQQNIENITDEIQDIEDVQIPAKMNNPMTAGGDLIFGGTSGTPTRLPTGNNGQILSTDGVSVYWDDPASVEIEGKDVKSTGEISGKVLTTDGSGGASWEDVPQNFTGSTFGIAVVISVGTNQLSSSVGSNGQFLTWNNGPVWTTVPNAEDEGV